MQQWAAGLVLIFAIMIGSWGVWDVYQHQINTIMLLKDGQQQQQMQIAQLNDRLVALDRQQRQQPTMTETATQLNLQTSRQSVMLLLQLAQQHIDHVQIPQALVQLQQLDQQLAGLSLEWTQQAQFRQILQQDIMMLRQQYQQQQQLWNKQDIAIARLQDFLQSNAQSVPQSRLIDEQSSWQTRLQGWVSIRRAQPSAWMDMNQRYFMCYQTMTLLGLIRTSLPLQQTDTLRRLWQDVDQHLAQLADGHSVRARQLAQQLANIAPPATYQLQSLQLWQQGAGVSS
jgi:hypothetical protein